MKSTWAWLAVNLERHALLVWVVGLSATALAGVGMLRLDFATGQDSYLDSTDQVAEDNRSYQDLFGGQAVVTLITLDEGGSVADLFSPADVRRFESVEDDIARTEGVRSVVTPLSALQFHHRLFLSRSGDPDDSVAGQALAAAGRREPDPSARQARAADVQRTRERLAQIPPSSRTLEDPRWVDFLLHGNDGRIRPSLRPFFPDDRHAQMAVWMVGNVTLEAEGEAADAVAAAAGRLEIENAEVLTAGAPLLLDNLNDDLRHDLLTLGMAAVAAIVLILVGLFDVRWRLLPLVVMLITVIWTFGLSGYFGVELSMVTIACLPVMLGVGIHYAIQMHSRIEEEIFAARSAHPISEAARTLGPALLVIRFDAIFALASLRFARVPMIQDFGLVLAIGIAAVSITSILVPLSLLGIREVRLPGRGRAFRPGLLGAVMVHLGNLPKRAAVPLVALSLAVFIGGASVEGRLGVQTDPVRWVNQDSDAVRDIERLEDEVGSSTQLGVLVESDDVFTDTAVGFVHGFVREQLGAHPTSLLTGTSLVTTMSSVVDVRGATPLPPRAQDVQAAYDLAPEGIRASTVSSDRTAMNVVFRTGPTPHEERAAIIDDIRSGLVPPNGVRAIPSGSAAVSADLLDDLQGNRVMLTYLSLAFVYTFLVLRFRSLLQALLPMLPVLTAVGASSLLADAVGLRHSPITVVGGPLVIAACTAFTSLILMRFIEERRRGLAPKAAIDAAALHTGRAFVVSGLATIAGVGVLAFSSLPLLRDFGIVVGLNVTVALLCALVFLPPMLVAADEHDLVTKPSERPPTHDRRHVPRSLG